jgi:hypothetical protein
MDGSFAERNVVEKYVRSIRSNYPVDMDDFLLGMPPNSSDELVVFLSRPKRVLSVASV